MRGQYQKQVEVGYIIKFELYSSVEVVKRKEDTRK